jgi:hypothetical protein
VLDGRLVVLLDAATADLGARHAQDQDVEEDRVRLEA